MYEAMHMGMTKGFKIGLQRVEKMFQLEKHPS
jgi:hypothetical protein